MSMSISVEELRSQLVATENELEQAKSHVYRCDGVILMLKHLIKEAETSTPPETVAVGDEPKEG